VKQLVDKSIRTRRERRMFKSALRSFREAKAGRTWTNDAMVFKAVNGQPQGRRRENEARNWED